MLVWQAIYSFGEYALYEYSFFLFPLKKKEHWSINGNTSLPIESSYSYKKALKITTVIFSKDHLLLRMLKLVKIKHILLNHQTSEKEKVGVLRNKNSRHCHDIPFFMDKVIGSWRNKNPVLSTLEQILRLFKLPITINLIYFSFQIWWK